MKPFYKSVSFLIALFSFISTSFNITFAANGKIAGKVTDAETGEALIGVNIVITHSVLTDGSEVPLDYPMGASTDFEGYYAILNVPPGVYNLRASLVGYNTVVQKGVTVNLDRTVEINFQLSSTVIEVEVVTVTAEQEIVKPDVSGTQEIISVERLEQLPVTRVDEFVGTLKGVEVVSGSQGHGLSIRGGEIRETDVRLDGISLQDPRSENSYLALNSTSIKEIQVLTSGFQAKYGGIRSGLLNVVTKEGQREKYTLSIRTDFTPANQRRHFGVNPWSDESMIYKVFAGEYAFRGIRTAEDSAAVPQEFHSFRGWAHPQTQERALDSLQKLELWKLQHPQYEYANKPDYFIEGTITGPFPGDFIPVFGEFASRTTFLLGFKYENTQLAFPIGPRNYYQDINGQIKLTTRLSGNMKLSLNTLYADIKSSSGATVASSYGGALLDEAQNFSYLNGTRASVNQQASLIGGFNHNQLFNKSRLQFFDQRYIIGGAKFTHTFSDRAFYEIDFQMGYTDQELKPFSYDGSDTTKMVHFFSERANRWYSYHIPDYGSPNASTNYGADVLNTYNIYGGPQRADSSYSYVYQLKGDLTAQIGSHHQIDAGFSARFQDLFIYAGTWYQSQLSFTPDTWQYYSATPLELGLYIQDKLEFEGMILNAGLRFDYLNPMKKSYEVGFPQDADYATLFNEIYQSLPGEAGSYERWVAFREYFDNPPGWPEGEVKIQTKISPRLGVAFPVTESSKLYFNYGHFYQRPPVSFMYNLYVVQGGVALPAPGLAMARTVSYEFGYEQMFLNDFIVNVTAYYKDVSNNPLARTYVNYYEDNIVTTYQPDAYKDIRGFEIRVERPIGRFVTFNGMYDYMIQTTGTTGLHTVYENRLLARDSEIRHPNMFTTEATPRANINLNLHTPREFGPEAFGIHWLEEIYASLFFEWRDGARILLNPQEPDEKLRNYIDAVDWWNIDLRAGKAFNTSFGSIEFVVTIKNLTNNKFLSTGNMTNSQYDRYKESLRTPNEGVIATVSDINNTRTIEFKGNDKWGEFHDPGNITGSNKPHIDTGWMEAPIFLNPRRIILGLRLNF